MNTNSRNDAGFSLTELLMAMAVSLTVMGLGTVLLASSFNVRSREDRKSDAIADVQRALNIMTREISNSGFRLPSGLASVSANGIVVADTDNQSMRVISNLNGMPTADPALTDTDVTDTDEDVKFLRYVDGDQEYIVRYERNATKQTTVLANRVDSLIFRYYDEKVTYETTVDDDGTCDITNVMNASGTAENEVSPALAKYIVIAVGVSLPEVGSPGMEGYQRPTQVQLTSDVVLRNSIVY
jgi:prepilin-type N-terminal cleavage/methylation domain-containing protein